MAGGGGRKWGRRGDGGRNDTSRGVGGSGERSPEQSVVMSPAWLPETTFGITSRQPAGGLLYFLPLEAFEVSSLCSQPSSFV